MAEKREKINEIGMLRRELKNLSVLQQKILHVAERRERREGMNGDRRQASPKLQRSSGAAKQHAARRGDRDDDRETDDMGKGRYRSKESVKKGKRGTNESTRKSSNK